MDTSYQFPVFFEYARLNDDQIRKIESHFHIRRKSGGGECGPLTEVGGNVYSIAFKDKEAQQRVLQRTEHIVGSSIVLTLRDNAGCNASSSNTNLHPDQSTSPNLKANSIKTQQQKHQSTISQNLPPNSEEFDRQLDFYLLRYLKETSIVKGELDNQLALLFCTAELQQEEGRVLVRRVAQPGVLGELKDWKFEVDKLFDGYTCHYEKDPHKVKALFKSYSSRQPTDEVKVYSDIGMAVVVGERSQVQARLIHLESISDENRGSRFSNTKTTIRRIGEAKLPLFWKEIESSLRQNFPALKVTQADEGKIVLAGPVEDILKAGDVITEKEKLVLERTIADKSPQFLGFLKKAYGGPRCLCQFLGVAEKVEAEIRDTTLHLFSFSANSLEYSLKKIQENFKEVKNDIPNCSVVPPELCKRLKSKVHEMNQKQYKANVVFGADGTVSLVGHSGEVEELRGIVSDFILDQTNIERKCSLPFSELARHLPEFLQLQGFDYSGVTFSSVTSSSPMVLLVGSSSKVTDVRKRLDLLLNSVVKNSVTVDLPGAARYFNGHSGRDRLLQVAKSHKCLIQVVDPADTSRDYIGLAKYNLQHGLQVIIYQGDITKQYADGIVNAANEDLNHIGGVAAALSKAGGPQVQKESNDIVRLTGKITVGDVVVTTGGDLKCKNLLHAVGPESGKARGRERNLVEKTVRKALDLAELMEFKSIALPCISSGVFGVPIKVCSEAIVSAIKEFGSQGGRNLSQIILIDKRGEVVRVMKEACDHILPGKDLGFNMSAAGEEAVRGTAAEAPVQVEIVQGTIENQQADAIVSPMVGHDPVSTRIGNVLNGNVGPQLMTMFHKEAGGTTRPGEAVVVKSLPGLKCKAVFFLNLKSWDNTNESAAEELRQGIKHILAHCDIIGYSSVALPVLGTEPLLHFPSISACRIFLEEVSVFEQNRTSSSPFLVRIVVHPWDKESSQALQSAHGSLHFRGFTNDVNPCQDKAGLKEIQDRWSRMSTFLSKQDQSFTYLKPEPIVLQVISCGPDATKAIEKDLKLIVQRELLERTVNLHSFSKIEAMELDAIQKKIKATGISLEHKTVDAGRSRERDQSESSKEVYVLKGLKEDVLSVIELINNAVQKALEEDLKYKDEAMLALTIQWAMKDDNGEWQELSLHDNYMVQQGHIQKKVFVEVGTTDGRTLKVNLTSLEATDWNTGKTYKLKRTESEGGVCNVL